MSNNLPPETWITAAPQDTLTTRDENGGVLNQPGSIPFRHHLYWSGSDQDGAVAGFYWAVVETVSDVPLPSLPGPKPQDYQYTTARDGVFIFSVFEDASKGRQHAFYIYAVDEKGKPDPTPARLLFNTVDKFPPLPVIDDVFDRDHPDAYSRAEGLVFHPDEAWIGVGEIPVPRDTTIALRDTLDPTSIEGRRTPTSQFVPVGSVVRMRWHSEITVADNPAVFYKYKIGEGAEVEFVQVPASVTGTEYNTTDRNRLGPGLKAFTLRALDQAGGARFKPQTTRRFYMNLLPDTWFAGPDIPTSTSFYTIRRYGNAVTGPVKEIYKEVGAGQPGVPNWKVAFPGSLLGPDSVEIMPAKRKANKTFFEIYTEYNYATFTSQHRVYVHGEGDTIHMNSWVLLHGGGFDADSPYRLRILNTHTDLPGIGTKPVLTSVDKPTGSPIGFRFRIPVALDPLGSVNQNVQSQVFPLVDPSVGVEAHIGGYQGLSQSGRAYAILLAEDGSGGLDERIKDPVAFVDSFENNPGSMHPARRALRDKVLTFYVNRAPYLTQFDLAYNNPNRFHPYEGELIYQRNLRLTLDKVADDDPPPIVRRVGGYPNGSPADQIFRFNVSLRGRLAGSDPAQEVTYTPPQLSRKVGVNFDQTITVPSFIAGPEVYVEIEICDCVDCETIYGQGRCHVYPPIRVVLVP